jgi:hypothetical protein
MEFERHKDELGGHRDAPPGKEEWLICSAGWASGELMLREERRMLLRGIKPGHGALM